MTLILSLVFVLSGAAGLIYESIWSRYLGLFVGHSAYAQVIVLVIFLGGMSLGAAVIARRSTRLAEPLLWYALIEAAVGLMGLAFHDVFGAVSALAYDTIFPALAGGPALVVVKWLIAALLILPQSVLLGATFPLMSAGLLRMLRASGRDPDAASGRVLGLLYFANSLGAAIGVLIAGFWLISAVGLAGTLAVAAAANLVVAAVTYAVLRSMRDELTDGLVDLAPDDLVAAADDVVLSTRVAHAPRDDATLLASVDAWRLLLAVAFGTAVASFIYEIAWIRMLALVLGSATHAFELMLSAFILGLALGALWIRRRADTTADAIKLLGIVQLVMGSLAIATLFVYSQSFHWMAALIEALDENSAGYRLYNLARYGISLGVMLPPTFCAGVTLPLITRSLLRGGHGERAIGAVYAWNTLGSIVGAALAALWLMPFIGLRGMLILGGAIDIALGVWLFAFRGQRAPEHRASTPVVAGLGAAVVAIALIAPGFDPGILSSGVFRYGTVPERGAREIVFYEDGRTASVSVRLGSDSGYSLATNGKPDASISRYWFDEPPVDSAREALGGDESTQVLLPLITLAHVPAAKQVAVIGHGSGISSHILLGSEQVEDVVTIDIEPQMIEASKLFKPVNSRAYDDPRSRFVHDDAKSFFAASNRKYDLILSEPSNPWVSGVSGLFTDEFYARVSGYLTPDGVFGQWLHLYEIEDDLVLSVLAALHRHFPSYAIYLTNDVDILVVASNRATLPRPDWSVLQFEDIALDLARFRPLNATTLDGALLATRSELAPLLDSAVTVNSDFRPTLDLGAERARFLRHSAYGFLGMTTARWDLAAALGERRVAMGTTHRPSLDLPRMQAQALAARLRARMWLPADDTTAANRDFQRARIRDERLRMWMNSGRAPADWFTWFTELVASEDDWHHGSMGVVDSAWYNTVIAYMREQGAPLDGISAVRMLQAVATYDWVGAAREVEVQIDARARGRNWIPSQIFYESAIVARLKVLDIAGARALLARMASATDLADDDLRMRLLDAYVSRAEDALDR